VEAKEGEEEEEKERDQQSSNVNSQENQGMLTTGVDVSFTHVCSGTKDV